MRRAACNPRGIYGRSSMPELGASSDTLRVTLVKNAIFYTLVDEYLYKTSGNFMYQLPKLQISDGSFSSVSTPIFFATK